MSCRNGWIALAIVALVAPFGNAALLWSERAENGTTFVIDGTAPTYPLIQSDVVAEGNNAFHLANPEFQANFFVLDRPITVQPTTKLFFMSQLRGATASQIARVEISTNGGSTWPTSVFNQPGSGFPGEGAFALKEVSLAGFANQDVRFRFNLDFTSGTAYTDVDLAIGWIVDNIQIGDEFEKLPFSIGQPTAQEQLALEYMNRARADAIVEANRLANETDSDVTSAYNSFGVTGPNIVEQFTWYVDNDCIDRNAQPLTFSDKLLTAARLHTQDMFNNQFQGHSSSSNPPAPLQPGDDPGLRLNRVGYDWRGYGENVFAFAASVPQAHASFGVDWGNLNSPGSSCYNPAFSTEGMQNPAGHRQILHNDDFKEVGIGVIEGTNGSVGPVLTTQDFGNPGAAVFATGVVYEDLNGNQFYDVGEGRGGVRVDVLGSAYYAVTSESGGYAVPVSQAGATTVTFSGGGFSTFQANAEFADRNIKIDYLVSGGFATGDLNQDGTVDAADAGAMFGNWGSSGIGDLNGDNLVDAADAGELFAQWTGDGVASVPEPGSALPLLLAMIGLGCLRRSSARRNVHFPCPSPALGRWNWGTYRRSWE